MERVLKYQEIESYMLQELSSGRFSVEDRFFSEADVARQFDVTILTARKAFAQLEMTRLERGMFMLDIIISAAPLLGLLGTVAGLVTVFATDDSIPSPETISKGVGLALSTTIMGLSIAIPAIVGNSYLNRRIDKLCARLNVCVESLIDIQAKSASK